MSDTPKCCNRPKIREKPREQDNYWLNESDRNLLKGCCCCHEENPIRLGDCFIINALQKSPKAREDFCKLYPILMPCEKERFDTLMAENPHLFKLRTCLTEREDNFQASLNSTPVRTVGPRGGTRIGGCVPLPPHLLKRKC